MRSVRIWLAIACLTAAPTVSADAWRVEAFDKNAAVAKAKALSMLAARIGARVMESCTQTTVAIEQKCNPYWHEEALPLLGVELTFKKDMAVAQLDPQQALPLYQEQLRALDDSTGKRWRRMKRMTEVHRLYLLLSDQYSEVSRFNRLAVVARALGEEKYLPKTLYLKRVAKQLWLLEPPAKNLAQAVFLFSRYLTLDLKPEQLHQIYVFPPTPIDSVEITPFSAVVSRVWRQALDNKPGSSHAPYLIIGKYRVMADGQVRMYFQLAHRHKGILRSHSGIVAKKAYGKLRLKPLSPATDALVHQKRSPQADATLVADLTTSLGRRDLLYGLDQVPDVKIRVNRPGYVYLFGHAREQDREFSFLAPIGKSRTGFVKYISDKWVNREIDLGLHRIKPGVNHLQLIASATDIQEKLPPHQWDEKAGVFVLDNTSTLTDKIAGIRKLGDAAADIDERVLTFTTLKSRCGRLKGLSNVCKPHPDEDLNHHRITRENTACLRSIKKHCRYAEIQ